MFKTLKSKKGNAILSFIIIVSVVAIMALAILPPLQEAIGNRIESTADSFNSTDTITTLE